MKKTILIVLCIMLVVASFCLLVSCKKDSEVKIDKDKTVIEKTTYLEGETYKQSDVKITATLTDGSTIDVSKNLVFVGDGEDDLKLKDGKFTTKGTYNVTVYYIEAREDYKLGVWTIVVA